MIEPLNPRGIMSMASGVYMSARILPSVDDDGLFLCRTQLPVRKNDASASLTKMGGKQLMARRTERWLPLSL
jgi:hypothetical protein